uniref:ATP synthase subunit a n=1 Tax=Walchia hayashii TaxID=436352 RepID=B3IUL7_9ACAR|nr:ATP synthase F0 subunit 6 [Walchia hayashii]BAG24171.1 ATPase subunit 6 [Walchia hayashii]
MFSPFDPSSFTYPTFLTILMAMMLMKTSKSKNKSSKKMMMKMLKKEIMPNLSSKNQKSSTMKFISMFTIIASMNMMGLLPSTFSITSQMSINLPLAMTMWIATNMFSMTKKKEMTLAHMVPNGTPIFLAPFMVMIEMVSNLIRPITLSVRLTANMVAGHILISLMENFITKTNPNIITSWMMASILTILESGVAIIQAYVFSTLVSLYFSENH